jgi:hypothetical protein
MIPAIKIQETFSQAPWSYEFSPYSLMTARSNESDSENAEIPAFEVFDADGNKIFDTNEDSPLALQECNARLAVAAPELLWCLMECARLLADHATSDTEEGKAYRRASSVLELVAPATRE